MLVSEGDEIVMRKLCAFLLASFLWLLPSILGADRAAAIFSCGMFDGKFQCKSSSGGPTHGKSAIPDTGNGSSSDQAPEGSSGGQAVTPPPANSQEAVQPGEHSCPPGYTVLAVPNASGGYCEPPAGASEATNMGCEHGMVGAPPSCHCPKNSELLGGNCVHYTATCRTGLAADAAPQVCQGADEKLACKMRQDGLKDCCCLTYDKM
jgi:hypothetical protein